MPADGSATNSRQCSEKWTLLQRLRGQLHHEMHEYGAMVYHTVRPGQMGQHWAFVMPTLAAVLCCVWTSMVAYFPSWLVVRNLGACQAVAPSALAKCVSKAVPTTKSGPAFMLSWVLGVEGRAFDLTFAYLNSWGALYAPLLAEGQGWRLLTSQLVHWNLLHLVGNVVVVLALGTVLERRFGWWRLALVWMASVVGGEMLALLAEDPCDQVIGASGGVFGLVGLFAADLALNWRQASMPILHAGMTLVFLIIFAVTVVTQPGISNMSHLGGLLAGLLASLAALPVIRKPRNRMQHTLRMLGAVLGVAYFVVTPWLVYARMLPGLSCSQ